MKKTRYFKPRQDLEYSSSLLPQKIENGKGYRFTRVHFIAGWDENYSTPDIETLKRNFIEVNTEVEAVEGY